MASVRFAVLTSSDLGARGERDDLSGEAAVKMLSSLGFELAERAVVPDEQEEIEALLRGWSDSAGIDLICTTGGTGLGPRDVTPEATAAIIDFEVPGIAEAIRAQTILQTPMAMLSRAKVGVRGRCLILNLPGSAAGVQECLQVVMPVLPHALGQLTGADRGH